MAALPHPRPGFLRRTFAIDMSKVDLEAAAVLTAAVAFCLAAGAIADNPLAGLMATTGALSAGFGAYQRFSPVPHAAMALAALGMSAGAFVGVLVAPSLSESAAASMLFAGICGFATRYGQASWWFTLQWSIALIIATAQPGGLADAVLRGGLVLGGAALQIGIVSVYWLWRPFGAVHLPPTEVSAAPPNATAALYYALIVGAMCAIATALERGLGLANGYWTPMTALIILRPQLSETAARTVQRIIGTLMGAAAATALAALARPNGLGLIVCIVSLAGAAYAAQRVNYAVFTFCITGAVAFLLALTGLPEPVAVTRRVLSTLLGAGLALGAGALVHKASIGARAS